MTFGQLEGSCKMSQNVEYNDGSSTAEGSGNKPQQQLPDLWKRYFPKVRWVGICLILIWGVPLGLLAIAVTDNVKPLHEPTLCAAPRPCDLVGAFLKFGLPQVLLHPRGVGMLIWFGTIALVTTGLHSLKTSNDRSRQRLYRICWLIWSLMLLFCVALVAQLLGYLGNRDLSIRLAQVWRFRLAWLVLCLWPFALLSRSLPVLQRELEAINNPWYLPEVDSNVTIGRIGTTPLPRQMPTEGQKQKKLQTINKQILGDGSDVLLTC